MSSSPKIVVLKMREVIYTLLLLFLAALLIVCMILMFTKKTGSADSSPENMAADTQTQDTGKQEAQDTSSDEALYTAGIYTTSVALGDSAVDVEVTVDQNHINSIRLVNLSEATAAAYPLVSPALEHIASQILESQSLENITCAQENKYTSQILLSAISDALVLAQTAN